MLLCLLYERNNVTNSLSCLQLYISSKLLTCQRKMFWTISCSCWSCESRSIRTAKVRLRFRRRTLHVPNQMHTLRINYINYIYPRGLRVPSTWHAHRTSFCTRWREKRNVLVLLVSKQSNILLWDAKDYKKKKGIYSWCAHALQTDRNFSIQAISKCKVWRMNRA